MFFEREVIEGYLALYHHCQESIVGSAESYNEQFRSSPVTLYSKSFLTRIIICEIQDGDFPIKGFWTPRPPLHSKVCETQICVKFKYMQIGAIEYEPCDMIY